MADPLRISAIIVTHERPEKLSRTLDAVARQSRMPDRIHVVDNASGDGTSEVVAGKNLAGLDYFRLEKNIGGAGGFNQGIKRAHHEGADFFWLLDDDAYPEPDALEKLLAAVRDFEDRHRIRAGFAASRVEWIDGSLCEMTIPEPLADWSRYLIPEAPYARIASCSFVSALIPRWAVSAHGLPIADYFIWFDDIEYTRRIAKSAAGIYVPQSRVIHDRPENTAAGFDAVTEADIAKFLYGARNQASYHRRERGVCGLLSFARQSRKRMLAGGVPRRLRLRIYRAIWAGAWFRPVIERP